MLMGDALGKESVRLGRCRLFRCFPTHTGLREMVSFRYFEASSILLYKFVCLSMAPPSVPALAVQSPAAPSVCLFAFSRRKKTRAFIFSGFRFLNNSFLVLLRGNKSAPPKVLLRPLISGAGNEMRWLSSRTASLSWPPPLFPRRVEAAGDGRGCGGGAWWGIRGGDHVEEIRFAAAIKVSLLEKKKKKNSVTPSTPPAPPACRFIRANVLDKGESGIGFVVRETQLPLVCLHRNGFEVFQAAFSFTRTARRFF